MKWDREAGQVHVTRSILCRTWEGYSDERGAILSRETVKRVRELVGTITLAEMTDAAAFRDELADLLFRAVVGTSRLPLTSVEAPLPAFVLGQLAYCYRRDPKQTASPPAFLADALRPEVGGAENVKLLEWIFRQPSHFVGGGMAAQFAGRWLQMGYTVPGLMALLRDLFNEVSLSPYLGLVAAVRRGLDDWVERGLIAWADEVDFLTHLLRQTGRHLTAFDLVRFHHRGANYPDALLVDEVLGTVLERAAQFPDLFLPGETDDDSTSRAKRLRRRGVRQGWLVRLLYRGHAVPDAPTSPGENARVWPAPVPHVPEEQILNVGRRPRRLFAEKAGLRNDDVVRAGIADLEHPAELRELGTALFLDRPFGVGKRPGEPDGTLLLSYVAFSRRIARERLRLLAADDDRDSCWFDALDARLRSAEFDGGVRFAPARPAQRAGAASLEDAIAVADDFVFVTSTRRSLAEFLRWYDVTPIAALRDVLKPGNCLLLRSAERPDETILYDERWERRAVLRTDVSQGYITRSGVEHPAAGLQVLGEWLKVV